MGKYCSFGKFNKRYFYIIIGCGISLITGFTSMYFFKYYKKNIDINEIEEHKLLKTLSRYIGFSLCIIGEFFFQKKVSEDENKPAQKKSCLKKYLLYDSDSPITAKDIIFFILICLLLLLDDFMIIFIKIQKKLGFLIFNEEYNFIEFILLFLITNFIFRINYYKHQFISIILIILLEIFRYVVKIYNEAHQNILMVFLLQISRALCDCIFFGYLKFLMEDKYCSVFKCCYIFGFVNLIILIVIYIIFSFIPSNNYNDFCSLKYGDYYYFDNIFAFLDSLTLGKIISFFFYSLSNGAFQVLINMIIENFTMCHLFIPCQIGQLVINIIETYRNGRLLSMVITSGVFEILISFIFHEAIELNFCGLNKNIKKNIINRANEDSVANLENFNKIEINDYIFDLNGEDVNNTPNK